MARKPNVNPHEKAMSALRIIRTWAAYQIEEPRFRMDPSHVLSLCDEAIALNSADKPKDSEMGAG